MWCAKQLSDQINENITITGTSEYNWSVKDKIEEISKQLSEQINENITITGTSEYNWSVVDDKNKIKIMNWRVPNELESTKIIQIYNEFREYKNNINKEFNLDCSIQSYCVPANNYIKINYDANNIEAKNYIELTEKVKKIEELKNQILLFGKEFNFSCTNNIKDFYNIKIINIVDKITINIYSNISINIYNKFTKFIKIYNEIRENRNSINMEFNLDCSIETYYNDNDIDLINNIILKYDNINDIHAKSFLECSEQIKKKEELKNKILSVNKDFDITYIQNFYYQKNYYSFDNHINNISIKIYDNYEDGIDIDLIIKSYNEIIAYKIDKDFKFIIEPNDEGDTWFILELNNIINDTTYTISIKTKELSLTFVMYNQFREYINNNGIDFDCDIDMTDKDNIIVYNTDMYDKCVNITVSNNNNIKLIIEIYK